MVLYGRRVAEEFCRAGGKAKKVWVKKTLLEFAKNIFPQTEIRVVPDKIIEKITGSGEHQGIAFEPKMKLTYQDFLKIYQKKKGVRIVVFLDGVQDVGNIGNIIRTSCFFDFDCVVVSDENSPGITPSLIKSSAGAFFHIPVSRMKRREFVEISKKLGLRIYSLDLKGEKSVFHFTFQIPFAICLGSEHSGVSSEILQNSDDVLKIPGSGKIDSLNVSSAFAVFSASFLSKSSPYLSQSKLE